MLGASSAITVVAGLAAAKLWAILVGPVGIGYFGLLSSLLGLATLVAGLGVSAAIVRFGAKAVAEEDALQTAALRKAAWLITLVAGGLACGLMLLFRAQLSEIFLGGAAREGDIPIVAAALLMAMISGLQTGLLNSEHRVGALAKYAVCTAIAGTAIEVAIVWRLRQSGIPFALLAGAAVGVAMSTVLVRNELSRASVRASFRQAWDRAGSMLRFGMPYTASMVVGTGVLLVMPVLVLHVVGSASVGYYRAAATIGIAYLGFLLSAMAQDYFPRVSAVHDRAVELGRMINQQQRLLMILAMPIILLALALAPIIVPILYSPKFSPASSILEWQLAGDVLRLSSWTMAFVVLARNGGAWFFATELIGGTATLAASWIGMQHYGVTGTGIGYLTGYAVYAAVVWAIVRRDIKLRFTMSNRIIFACSVASVALIRVLPLAGLTPMRLPVALLLGICFGLYSSRAIIREFDLPPRLWSWRDLRARAATR
jgi:PST family polysaccharide transporter